MTNCCAICKYLVSRILRKGIEPYCQKGKIKFKARTMLDFTATDLNNNKCKLFIHYQE